jgi:putative methionine-R-sulfoxide reductase with GAF domain
METLGTNPVEGGAVFPPPGRTRRRLVRQRVHTPAYASLNGSASGQILDLSEIVDIHEEGMAIQTSSPLHAQRTVNLCLDLTATKACIHTAGEVIWTDRSGRVGIRFPQMPEASVRQLKEWLFVNLLVACTQHRAEQVALPKAAEKLPYDSALVNWMRKELEPTAPADYTSILTALAAVKREAEALGHDLDGTLQLLAYRALTFTRATGAAIALTRGPEMICRASAGSDAPSLGARFGIGKGFSGECVRTGRVLSCEDSETDPVVDRESCRALGIRSMIAVPIRWQDAIIGLLEVFSPEPYAFGTNVPLVLKRLAGICSAAVYRSGALEPDAQGLHAAPLDSRQSDSPQSAAPASAPCVDDEFPVESPADLPLPHFSWTRKILLAAAAVTVIFAGSWLISPRDFNGSSGSTLASQAPAKPAPKPLAPPVVAADGFEGIRRLAEQGDPAAQFSVGARYATGEDVPHQDYAEAVRWFSMAAEHGHVVSQATLGAYYWAGRGVPQDLVKAYFWSVLAQTGGDETSKYRVIHLASRMTRSQITDAQQQANDWLKEHQSMSQSSPPTR